jgi:hypothetical protein
MDAALSLSDKQKTLAFPARVPSVFGGASLLATVPPRSSVLPPGAGNKLKEPIKAEKRAKKLRERYVGQPVRPDRHVDTATIGRHDDGDGAAVLAIELGQCGLHSAISVRLCRAVSAV